MTAKVHLIMLSYINMTGINREGVGVINTLTIPAPMPHSAVMKSMLNTADPTIVPTPTSDLAINTPRNSKIFCGSPNR